MATACVVTPAKEINPIKTSCPVKCSTKFSSAAKSLLQKDCDFAFDSGGERDTSHSWNYAPRPSHPCKHFSNKNRPIIKVSGGSLMPSNEKNGELLPVIRISLNKPRHWKCKLTTCSCTRLLSSIQDVNNPLFHNFPTKLHSKRSNSKNIPSQDTLRMYSKPVDVILCENKNCKVPVFTKARNPEEKSIDLLVVCDHSQDYVIPVGERLSVCKQRKRRTENVRKSWPANPEREHFGESYENKLHKCSSEKRFECVNVASASVPKVPGVFSGMRGTEYFELSSQQRTWERICRKTGNHIFKIKGTSVLPHKDGDVPQNSCYQGKLGNVQKLNLYHSHYDHTRSSLNWYSGMGSNVSRHSEKGLSGRRTQSSGNLCNGHKVLAPSMGRIFTPCGGGGGGGVGPKDRNKFSGSLPNHLDSKPCEGEVVPNGNNNNEHYFAPTSATVELPGERKSQDTKNNEIELHLHPLHQTVMCDQGYSSKKTLEETHPPEFASLTSLTQKYSIIGEGAKFEVNLVKGSRGLGLSVTGGIDSGEQWPGLIRIKRLFPHQPAWQTGCLSQGDIILAANGVSLVGCSNYEALEVLRKTPSRVTLSLCRPPSDAFSIQPQTDPPPPPKRDPAKSRRQLLPLPPLLTEGPCGEFDVVLTKVNHSLGFTLRKEDESVLGHYVRALVRDPALSNGSIRPGDKIIAVNDVDISSMSHEEAVMFLRHCGDKVKLRLYRDAAQTPVSALSPTEESKTLKPKPLLRKEAMDMLSNLAVKKLSPVDSNASTGSKFRRVLEGQGASLSPQKSQRNKNLTPDASGDTKENPAKKYLVSSQLKSSSVGEGHSSSNFLSSETKVSVSGAAEITSSTAVVEGANETGAKPQRPNFLDVQAGGGTTPGACRKHKFTFSSLATGSEDTDSFDPTSDTTSITLGSISQYYTTSNSSEDFRTGSINNSDGCLPLEPMSMPPLKNLSSTSSTSTEFSYKNPAYQSANPAYCLQNGQNNMKQGSEELAGHASDQDIPRKVFSSQSEPGGTRGLLKWKGVVFTPEKDEVEEIGSRVTANDSKDNGDLKTDKQGEQVFMVELTRGWNSRLGFSLRGDGQHTYISAIYEDSVAAKDGRLQAGDQVLMVNDESVQDMSTAEVIDLLRKIRGTIGITVLRRIREPPKNLDS